MKTNDMVEIFKETLKEWEKRAELEKTDKYRAIIDHYE